MILVVMAAGLGSRYGGPKQIDPVGADGEFIVDYSVKDAIRAGFDKVIFIIKPENRPIFDETIGKRIKGIDIEYAYQLLEDYPVGGYIPEGRKKPWGTGHAIYAARYLINDNFAVINADDFYGRESFAKVGEYLKNAQKGQYCMAGFMLKNTITANGSVSRGVCSTDENGYLQGIVERTKIVRSEGRLVYLEKDAVAGVLDENTLVSMNLWGFTPDFMDTIIAGFERFIKGEHERPLKDEYFLPTAVTEAMSKGASVKVLQTGAKWFGVTYPEDKPDVVKSIRDLIAAGEYDERLWR